MNSDDSLELQNRLDDPANDGYLLIEREYNVSRPLIISSRRTVECGPLGRLLASEDFDGPGMLQIGHKSGDGDWVRIISPFLDGNKTVTQRIGKPGFCGIYAWGASFVDVIDGYINGMPDRFDARGQHLFNTGDGIYLGKESTCSYWNIRGVSINGSGRNGITIINGKFITVTECHIRSCDKDGIDLEPNKVGEAMWGIRIVNNTLRRCSEGGIRIHTNNTTSTSQFKRPVIILGNTIEENQGKSIEIDDQEIDVVEYANVKQYNGGDA